MKKATGKPVQPPPSLTSAERRVRPHYDSSGAWPVIAEIAASVARQGPLRIDQVEFVDPTVILAGDAWSLAITCPWRLLRGSSLVVRWDDKSASDAIWDLVGHSIIEVLPRSAEHPNDPFLVLTGAYGLEIEADSDLDPWVLRMSDHTFVGSGSDD